MASGDECVIAAAIEWSYSPLSHRSPSSKWIWLAPRYRMWNNV
jgi:hypothetical protein